MFTLPKSEKSALRKIFTLPKDLRKIFTLPERFIFVSQFRKYSHLGRKNQSKMLQQGFQNPKIFRLRRAIEQDTTEWNS